MVLLLPNALKDIYITVHSELIRSFHVQFGMFIIIIIINSNFLIFQAAMWCFRLAVYIVLSQPTGFHLQLSY